MARILAALVLVTLALPAGAEPLSALELLPLPPVKGRVSLETRPLARSIIVASPHGTPAIARSLRTLSRILCPHVTELPGRTVLTCRSALVVARLVPRGALLALELREQVGLPASGDLAMPLVLHDPLSLGLGSCPGANHAARGECRLRNGRPELARGSFLTASRSRVAAERDHAQLRLGDLDLASGDVTGAQRRWSGIEADPWRRMAAARRCELSLECLEAKGDAPFSGEGLPISVAREMALRWARVRAFRGETLAAAWTVADQLSPSRACAGEVPLCREIVLAALRSTQEAEAREALAIYVASLAPDGTRLGAALASAAAPVAERNGAPAFAAALLSSVSAAVPEPALEEHLLRTAELYVAAGDAVRARVIVDFLRSRPATPAPRGPRWAALLREVALLRAPAAPARSESPSVPLGDVPELAAAARAIARARSAAGEGAPVSRAGAPAAAGTHLAKARTR